VSSDIEYAQVSELLSSSEGEKQITVAGKSILIKKINMGELSDILKVSKESELEQYIWVVYKGVLKPKLTVDQTRKLAPAMLLAIALEIQKFSGLDKDSVSKLENLLGTQS